MAELYLEWIEAGNLKTQHITPNQVTKQSGVTRIGRDPNRCDVVLADGSVSGLHVEIGYDAISQSFYLQNLRESNPPVVNNQPLPQGRVLLQPENTIQLGNLQIRAIATQSPSPDRNVLPATELQSPAQGIPPQGIPPYSPPQSSGNHYQPPQVPGTYPGNTPPPAPPSSNAYQYSTGTVPGPGTEKSQSGAKGIWIILGVGGVLLALFALAWPNISDFLGLGSSSTPVSEEPSQTESTGDSTNGDPLDMSDLDTYSHPSGLFTIDFPAQWEFLDNSQPGDIVIQGWHHPQLNAYVIIRIFAADNALNRDQLQNFGANVVDDLFGDLDNFQRGNPQPLLDQSVKVDWEAQDGPDTLRASTFVQQDGLNLSALSVWVPEGVENQAELQADIDQIVASFEVDGDIEIP